MIKNIGLCRLNHHINARKTLQRFGRLKTPPALTLTWWLSLLRTVFLILQHPPLVLSVKTTLRLPYTMVLEKLFSFNLCLQNTQHCC